MTEETRAAITQAQAFVKDLDAETVEAIHRVIVTLPALTSPAWGEGGADLLKALADLGRSTGTQPLAKEGDEYIYLHFRVTQKSWRRRANFEELLVGITTLVGATEVPFVVGADTTPWPGTTPQPTAPIEPVIPAMPWSPNNFAVA